MTDHKRIRLIVSGRVQGVGFRYYTQRQGERMGLVGWVKNLADGKVEAEAQGVDSDVDRFVEAVKKGPSAARVIDLNVQDIPATQVDDAFEIRMF